MALTVVGSIAFDSVRTPFGERERMLGGSAVHFALAASFFTDVGMVGPLDSVIGIRKELSIERFLTQRHSGFEVAKNLVYLQGVVIEIDDATGRGLKIERIREHLPGT